MSLTEGQSFRHYTILEKLGEGGMGIVYKAKDERLDRLVALKILPPDRISNDERKRRFVQEARAASALNHSNIVTIYDIDSADGRDFIAMEYVGGHTLAQWIEGEEWSVGRVVKLALQISDALAAAHAKGIIHRDLKPANVMVTPQGAVKVLDFGLAKLTESVNGHESTRTIITGEGTILGTVPYMSPEQAEGTALDSRSDIFSFGSVLYEMATRRRAFPGSSKLSILSSILRVDPEPPAKVNWSLPLGLELVITRCLRKNPDERFQSMSEVHSALEVIQRPENVSAAGLRRFQGMKAIGAAVVIVVMVTVALAGSLWRRQRNLTWALETAVPEVRRLVQEDKFPAAFILAERAQKYLPHDPELARLLEESSYEVSIQSDPPGAAVSIRGYPGGDSWLPLGTAPIARVRVPAGWVHWRFSKPGYQTVDRLLNSLRSIHSGIDEVKIKLIKEETVPADMVYLQGGDHTFQVVGLEYLQRVPIQDFYLDRYEVSNQKFKRFVDAGGYREAAFWKQPFVKDGKTLSWEEVVSLFRDKTGRPGPANWELGDYPPGQADYPVTGVSWYEAAAYAEFAGKSLPPVAYWSYAAQPQTSADVVIPLSNFSSRGMTPTGRQEGLNVNGTFDMAGNVKEWCWNEAGKGTGKRFILGGAWDDQPYQFSDPDAQSPFARDLTYGFRCIRYAAGVTPQASLMGSLELFTRKYTSLQPVSQEVFRTFARFYAYDRTPLKATIDYAKEEPKWRKEKVSFDTAYNGERMSAYLFLPKTGHAPFQAGIYFPGAASLDERSSENLETYPINVLTSSGRAVLYPVYKGTYERGDGFRYDRGAPTVYRDHVVQAFKDYARSIDYLETRPEIDRSKLFYWGLSWGASMATRILALDKRAKVGVLVLGGFSLTPYPPEVDPLNFAPRVTMPILMVNGRYDFLFPLEDSQLTCFRALGTPAKDKRHVVFDTTHRILPNEFAKEILGWLDQYLGTPN